MMKKRGKVKEEDIPPSVLKPLLNYGAEVLV
jgi:hypothetical protein